MNPAYLFWGVLLPFVCIVIIVGIFRRKTNVAVTPFFSALDKLVRYIGLVFLALMFLGFAYILTVGFPE